MKKVILFALVLGVCGVLHNSALAQQEVPRYLVTYVKSQGNQPRSATAVTVINQSSEEICNVQVEWFRTVPVKDSVCILRDELAPGEARQFCSRRLQGIVSCFPVATPANCPELAGNPFEGTAVVSSTNRFQCSLIAVDARVYYTTPGDAEVSAISNPKIVFFGEGNLGD